MLQLLYFHVSELFTFNYDLWPTSRTIYVPASCFGDMTIFIHTTVTEELYTHRCSLGFTVIPGGEKEVNALDFKIVRTKL